MRTRFAAALALALALGAPLAEASPESEADPRCEEAQAFAGYGLTRPLAAAWREAGVDAWACEGEHWDGQEAEGAYASADVVAARAAVSADDGTLAVYAQDGTPGNVVFLAASALRLWGGHVAEGDCTHEEYEGSMSPIGQPPCGRDNTAVTIEHDLLP